jgi:hypothetical protein
MGEVLLSKKFIFALVAVISGFILVILDKTTADVFFKFAEIIGGVYVVGNISDKINDSRVEIADLKQLS